MKKLLTAIVFTLCAQLSFAQDAAQAAPKTVTFVCEYGVAKSVIAAQYFNKIAKEQGVNYVAVSRGIASETTLQAATSNGLKNDGFDTSKFSASNLSPQDNESSERVVLIGIENTPSFVNQAKLTNWAGVPAVGKDYAAARDDMVARIKMLISELPK